MDTNILIVGCGDLGCELAKQLNSSGYAVTGLRRSNGLLPSGVTLLQADVTQPQTLQQISILNPAIVVYCVAANAQTDDSYRAQYVDGLRNVLNALKGQDLHFASNLSHVFFVSSTRVYGQKTSTLLDELTQAVPADFGGERLLEAELLLKTLSCQTTVLRLSGIYGPGRRRMINLAQQPHAWPQNNIWTNRIHRDDAARFIGYLIKRRLNKETVDDCYLVTDNQPASQYEVLMWLAGQLAVDTSQIKVPPITGGKCLSNLGMHNTDFSLNYPDYRAGYSSLLNIEQML